VVEELNTAETEAAAAIAFFAGPSGTIFAGTRSSGRTTVDS
jgi:hypothetical protein